MRRRRAIVAAMGGGGIQYGAEQTLTLQPDGTAGKDTLIIGDVNNTRNYGAATFFTIGESTGDASPTRTLIQFDLSSIPADALIVSATLSLYAITDNSSTARTFRVYRLKRAWVEGTRTGQADDPATGATWNRYDTVSNWQTAGGFGADDCEQTDIGSRAFTATETLNEFKDFSLTPSEIQEIVAGTWVNNGFLIKADTELDDRYDFASSDNATAANRPKLVVAYQVPL